MAKPKAIEIDPTFLVRFITYVPEGDLTLRPQGPSTDRGTIVLANRTKSETTGRDQEVWFF